MGQATPKIWLPEAISDLPISIQIMNGPQQKLTFIYLTLKENTHIIHVQINYSESELFKMLETEFEESPPLMISEITRLLKCVIN